MPQLRSGGSSALAAASLQQDRLEKVRTQSSRGERALTSGETLTRGAEHIVVGNETFFFGERAGSCSGAPEIAGPRSGA